MHSTISGFAVLLFTGALCAAPADLTSSLEALKDAVAKNDPAPIKQLAADTFVVTREVLAAPNPTDPAELDAAKKQKAFAREVESYAEYAVFATAVKAEPAVTIDLLVFLEQQSPKSKYMGEAYAAYFYALQQTGESAKILPIAEKALVNQPNQEDLLLVLCDNALTRKQTPRAAVYAERLVASMAKRSKPDSMSAADWERKRSLALGRGYWVAGLAHGEKNEHFQCDKDFKAALPFIKDNPQLLAPAYFYLGVSNYHLGRSAMNRAQILAAAKYSEQCATIPGPYQSQAWTNTHLMRTEADRMVARK
jgi:tetratricopeptide (TPR) repeat protein